MSRGCQRQGCACSGRAASPCLSWVFTAISRQEAIAGGCCSVFWFRVWFSVFGFGIEGSGSRGCGFVLGRWHVGPAVLTDVPAPWLTPSLRLWPCCRRDPSAAAGQRGGHTPGSLLCPGQSPCRGGSTDMSGRGSWRPLPWDGLGPNTFC